MTIPLINVPCAANMDVKPYISLKTWDMKAESTLKKDRKITERTVVTTWNSLKTFWIYAIQQK